MKTSAILVFIFFSNLLSASPISERISDEIFRSHNIKIKIPSYIPQIESQQYLKEFKKVVEGSLENNCPVKFVVRVDRENYGYPFNTLSWSFSPDMAFFSLGYDKFEDEVNMFLYSGSRSGDATAKKVMNICSNQNFSNWDSLYDLKLRIRSGVPRFLTGGSRPGKNFHKFEPTFDEVLASLKKMLSRLGKDRSRTVSHPIDIFVSNSKPSIYWNGRKVKDKAFEYKVAASKYFKDGVYQEEQNYSYELVYKVGFETEIVELMLGGYFQ